MYLQDRHYVNSSGQSPCKCFYRTCMRGPAADRQAGIQSMFRRNIRWVAKMEIRVRRSVGTSGAERGTQEGNKCRSISRQFHDRPYRAASTKRSYGTTSIPQTRISTHEMFLRNMRCIVERLIEAKINVSPGQALRKFIG